MPLVTVDLNARRETAGQPIIWRLAKLFNVVTNILRARVTEDYAAVSLTLEGSTEEVEQAISYLKGLGIVVGSEGSAVQDQGEPPENAVPQQSRIFVRLDVVNAAQAKTPILFRICKDFDIVVNIESAAFDDEDGGTMEILLSGQLFFVQRAIAYLHTTGIHVNPRQRSVTDYSNL